MIKNNIFKKYRDLSAPVKATVWFTACTFLQKGISLLTTPFFTRLLPTVEYGRLSLFNSWESIVLILITLSSSHAIMNLCVKYENTSLILSSITGFNITIALVFVSIVIFFIKPICLFTGLSSNLIIALLLYCFFQYTINCWIQIKNYLYSYKIVVIVTLFYTAINSFGGLVAVLFVSRTAEARIFPQILSVTVIGFIIILTTFLKNKIFYDHDIWKYTLFFCVPQLPHYFSEIILMSSDKIMINRMCGISDVAVYSIGYTVGSLINMITGSINSAFAPYQFQKLQKMEYKQLAKNTNYIITFIGVCLCCLMLFGREIVLIFGGKKYIDSISLIIPIALGIFFNYVFQLFARVQEFYEQKYTIVIASVSCAVLNIVLNYIFIKKFGYQAAAYTTFFCYFVFCILHYCFYRIACRKHVGQEIYDVKSIVFISGTLIVASVCIGFINKVIVLKYVLLCAGVFVIICLRKQISNFIKVLSEKD